MPKQVFADAAGGPTEFDMGQLKGWMSWEQFMAHVRDKSKKASIMRVRFIGDSNPWMFDLSYCYLEVGGEFWRCSDFPLNHVDGPPKFVRKKLYEMAKKEGVFIPGLFDNLSIYH